MWVGGWDRGSLDDAPSSDDVIPPLVQVHLLSRGTSLLSFRSGRLACGDVLSAAFGHLLCKSHPRFLALHTDTVVRCVVSPAATAMRLLPQGRASTREVGVHTSNASGCVSTVTLHVAEALAAFALQRAFWSHDFTNTRKLQSSVSDSTFDTSGPHATDTMKWGGGRAVLGGGRIAAA